MNAMLRTSPSGHLTRLHRLVCYWVCTPLSSWTCVAAKPSATYKGYLLGGLCWFAVPFTMATSMGLGARALNLPITVSESNAGGCAVVQTPT